MRRNCGVIVEDNNRKLLICNSRFCELFGIPISPEKMIGEDCSKSAEFVKHLFKNPDKFVKDIDKILLEKKPIIDEKIYMKDGNILIRDYLPIFAGEKYMGHTWQYHIYESRIDKTINFLKNIFK